MRSGQPSPALVSSHPPYAALERRPSQQQYASRAEEAIAARESLNTAKSENEELVAQVKHLEKVLKDIGGGDEVRGWLGQRSEAQDSGGPSVTGNV